MRTKNGCLTKIEKKLIADFEIKFPSATIIIIIIIPTNTTLSPIDETNQIERKLFAEAIEINLKF